MYTMDTTTEASMHTAPSPCSGDTTYHKDGTVTIWDCIRQSWVRGHLPSDALLATLNEAERRRVLRHVGQGGRQ